MAPRQRLSTPPVCTWGSPSLSPLDRASHPVGSPARAVLQGRQRGRPSPAVTPSAPSAGAPNAERRSGARPAVVVLAAQREAAPAALTAQRQARGEGSVPSRGTHRRRHQPQPRRPWVGDGQGPRGIRKDPCARRGRGGRHGTDASDGGPRSGAERRGTSRSRPGPRSTKSTCVSVPPVLSPWCSWAGSQGTVPASMVTSRSVPPERSRRSKDESVYMTPSGCR